MSQLHGDIFICYFVNTKCHNHMVTYFFLFVIAWLCIFACTVVIVMATVDYIKLCLKETFLSQISQQCGHLWVLDSGRVNISTDYVQGCPAKLRVYDLSTNQQSWEYTLPSNVLTSDSLLGTIELQGSCANPFAYLADIVGHGIVVVDASRLVLIRPWTLFWSSVWCISL